MLLDSYERLAVLDDWVREELLPDLPVKAVTVLAGRLPPGPGWRADPGWRDLLRVLALRNLTPEEGRDYLRRCGVPEPLHGRLLEVSYGHPLGLSLLADQVLRHDSPNIAVDSPDLVATLVQRFLGTVPDLEQRRALEVCALARVTTEPLLRAALDVADARDLFDWIRRLSFVEAGPAGLFPHVSPATSSIGISAGATPRTTRSSSVGCRPTSRTVCSPPMVMSSCRASST